MNLRNHTPKVILALILLTSAAIMIAASYSDSIATEEAKNISVFFGDKNISANDSLYSLRFATVACAIMFLLFLYIWAKKFLGSWWGILPVGFTAFSPAFLAYGHYVRQDIIKYFAVLIFIYFLTLAIEILSSIKLAARKRKYLKLIFYAAVIFLLALLFSRVTGIPASQLLPQGKRWLNLGLDYSLRETLPALIFSVAALFLAIRIALKKLFSRESISNYIALNPAEVSIAIFISAYAPLLIFRNASTDYIFSLTPFVYVLSASIIKNFVKSGLNRRIKFGVTIFLLVWHIGTALLAYPFYSSYLNELTGLNNKWRYSTGAKYDLGVDLKRLDSWLSKNKISTGKIGLDYYGGSDPNYHLNDKYVNWISSYNAPIEIGIDYIGVSLHKIYEAKRILAPGEKRSEEDEYLWLNNIYNPYKKIGSIHIYKIR